jgi:hypothetical protein
MHDAVICCCSESVVCAGRTKYTGAFLFEAIVAKVYADPGIPPNETIIEVKTRQAWL